MADNYIERKMAEISEGKKHMHTRLGIDSLINFNRSTRGYDSSYAVHEFQLRAIVSVNSRIASARNQQLLRFHLATGREAAALLPLLGMGGALPELHLPLAGTEPNAFIVICTSDVSVPHLEFDEGISSQTMLLKAAEMGLNGLIIKNFNPSRVKELLKLELTPTTVIAIGRSAETIRLVKAQKEDSLKYYRQDGIHYVPKIDWESLLV